ncbi:hypothetical protein [Dermacoccus nishinomiyaensis]|uniref:hypothetical protein n=1 Tax=Dermacoccus nishinomiyaensis TaxID=1274 RepID=UPI00119E946B|nr:hypothetical protein [Dermacoccus nishinomiyaensis]NHC30892.1 hypothetical protein [Dermacoccus nishinomiyaensis]
MIALTVFEIGASIVTVEFVKSHGGSDFSAYMWSLLAPAVGALVHWARTRHASGARAAILAFNLCSAALVIANSSFQSAFAWTQIMTVAAMLVGITPTVMIARRLRLDGQRAAAQHRQ